MSQSRDESPPRTPHQFSVRNLLTLMLVISIGLTASRLSRGSQIFAALASPWTWVSFFLIAAVWAAARRRRDSPQRLVAASILTYSISMTLPAFWMAEDDVTFGYLAWLQSFAFGSGSVMEFFEPPNENAWLHIHANLLLSCLMGLVANSLVILSWISFYAAHRHRPPRLVGWFAWASFALMVGCLIPVALAGFLLVLYPGFALWSISSLFVAVAANRNRPAPQPVAVLKLQ